jgi:pimeloyl-ACP methyl ester carboxylesterase
MLAYIRTKFKLLALLSKKKAAKKAFEFFQTPLRRRIQVLTSLFENAESLQFKISDISVNGWRWNKDAGKKLLIVHGFESSATGFGNYISNAIDKGYEVVAFDAPAHGRSQGNSITLPLYKKMLQITSAQYGPFDAYLAHSFGALSTVMALEDIKHTNETKIILIAAATETVTAINDFFRLLKLSKSIRPYFDSIIVSLEGHEPSWYSIDRAIRNLKARTIWFHDEDDDTTPIKDILKLKDDNLPNVRFVITKGLGHRRIYHDRTVQREIFDFL